MHTFESKTSQLQWKIEHTEEDVQKKASLLERELEQDDRQLQETLAKFEDELEQQRTRIQQLHTDREQASNRYQEMRTTESNLQQRRGQCGAELDLLLRQRKQREALMKRLAGKYEIQSSNSGGKATSVADDVAALVSGLGEKVKQAQRSKEALRASSRSKVQEVEQRYGR